MLCYLYRVICLPLNCKRVAVLIIMDNFITVGAIQNSTNIYYINCLIHFVKHNIKRLFHGMAVF